MLEPGAERQPLAARPFRQGPDLVEHVAYHVKNHTKLENIGAALGPWASAGFVVRERGKPHGRFVVDYRAVNRVTVRGHHPMPDIWAMLQQMSGGHYLSAMDLNMGFHHM